MMRSCLLFIFVVVLVAFGVGQGEGQDPAPDDNDTTVAAFFESAFAAIDDYARTVYVDLQAKLAWAYLQLGQQEQAFALMNQVVQAAEDHAATYRVATLTWRAQLYVLAFDYAAAVNDMNAAIDLKPDEPELYALRGQYILLTYEWDQVLADYNQAIALDPDYADAYFLRGVLFYTQGPRENALDDFEYYLELAPNGLYAEDAANYSDLLRVEFAALDD